MTISNTTASISTETSKDTSQHYITYESRQWMIEDIETGAVSGPYLVPSKRFPIPLKPTKMPTYLVRVANMEVVLGSDVQEGYCALSYSWSCSGDMVYNKEEDRFDRDDKGLHTIVLHHKGAPSITTKSVKFERVIQQLCKDFNVSYIWFDQMCINQNDEKEKGKEIKRMHSIYANAHCVIALIPELKIASYTDSLVDKMPVAKTDVALTTDWSKRAWTLQETYMAKRLLFVGENAHLWSSVAAKSNGVYGMGGRFLHSISIRPQRYNASTILFHAHKRTSRKLHDTVFALANLFPTIMQDIDVNYEESILDLKAKFYELLAEKDLSILCYGSPESIVERSFMAQREKFALPSWTGNDGMHIPFMSENDRLPETDFADYVVNKQVLRVRSATITFPIQKTTWLEERIPDKRMEEQYFTAVWEPSQQMEISGGKVTVVYSSTSHESITKHSGLRVTHWIPMVEDNLKWFDTSLSRSQTKKVSKSTAEYRFSEVYLSLTEENCTECSILFDIPFDIGSSRFKAYPVVRTELSLHKSIGLCFAYNLEGLAGQQREEVVEII